MVENLQARCSWGGTRSVGIHTFHGVISVAFGKEIVARSGVGVDASGVIAIVGSGIQEGEIHRTFCIEANFVGGAKHRHIWKVVGSRRIEHLAKHFSAEAIHFHILWIGKAHCAEFLVGNLENAGLFHFNFYPFSGG